MDGFGDTFKTYRPEFQEILVLKFPVEKAQGFKGNYIGYLKFINYTIDVDQKIINFTQNGFCEKISGAYEFPTTEQYTSATYKQQFVDYCVGIRTLFETMKE